MKQLRRALVVCICALSLPALADVKLPAFFSDNMVLQKMDRTPFFGTADLGETVTVRVGNASNETIANAAGQWKLAVDTRGVQGAVDVVVKGKNTITIKNVLVGEVWIASGQSNMEMAVASSKNLEEEKAAANFPEIRMFTVVKATSDKPLSDVKGKWEVTTPQTVGGFSAVGYFFARELNQKLGVPVGIIHTSWGGTVAEAWTSKEALAGGDEDIKVMWDRWDNAHSGYTPEIQHRYESEVKMWQEGGRKGAQPKQPAGAVHANAPTALYNAMISPLVGYGIKGAIWYQGESNAGRAYQYRKLFPLMISDWRQRWRQGNFPFYFVQLANFKAKDAEPKDSDWAELREAQTMTLAAPNTGMAVIIDIGDDKDIHPKNKQDVGKRLAQWALKKDYGKSDVEESGPLYDSMKVEGDSIRINFKHAGGGLVAKGDALTGFAIAGEDKNFVWADAKIDGDSIVVKSDKVAKPVAVRYAWANNPTCNLYNKADLPASPFRTDDWAGVTMGKK